MTQENELRAYSQWVEVEVFAVNMDVTIKEANLKWGKFYEAGNKNAEIEPSKINGYIIDSGKSYKISSCGRSNASSGTQGSFALYHGDTYIGTYSWDCPWSGKNSDSLNCTSNTEYSLSKTDGNYSDGALGNIKLTCIKVR